MRRRGDPTLKSLRDLRSLRVLIVHPNDRDGEDLLAQVSRIGCQAKVVWPPSDQLSLDVDIVFLLFRQEHFVQNFMEVFNRCSPAPALIGIIEFENPTSIDSIVNAGTSAVITKPMRGFGLMTSMVLAHVISRREKASSDRIAKLEARVGGVKRIEQAKAILMHRDGMTESDAYEMIRASAMARRISMEEFSEIVVSESESTD